MKWVNLCTVNCPQKNTHTNTKHTCTKIHGTKIAAAHTHTMHRIHNILYNTNGTCTHKAHTHTEQYIEHTANRAQHLYK